MTDADVADVFNAVLAGAMSITPSLTEGPYWCLRAQLSAAVEATPSLTIHLCDSITDHSKPRRQPLEVFLFDRHVSRAALEYWHHEYDANESSDEPWKVEDRGEKPAIALKGR